MIKKKALPKRREPKPVVRLPVISVRERFIPCPYQHSAHIYASVCFVNQRNATHPFCFRCPDGAVLEEKYGARTYEKFVSFSLYPPPERPYLSVRVPASKKKHGVEFTYAKVFRDGRVEKPFKETADWRVPFLGGNDVHFKPMKPKQLEHRARLADRERKLMIRGGMKATSRKGKNVPVGPEMAKLIKERKAKDKAGGWYRKIMPSPAEMERNKVLVKMGESAAARNGAAIAPRPIPISESRSFGGGLKKKKIIETASEMISKAAKSFGLNLKKKG